MKLSEVQVGDKLHIVDDLFGTHKKIEVVEVKENGVLALNYRNKQVTIQSDELMNYKKEA
ncbi:MAG: hypothetical protein VYD54_09485 [Bdellovibrionota bacterium]|nr:hypothetical protein [Bdellovibrionota bacterium]